MIRIVMIDTSLSFLVGHWWEPLPAGAPANPQAHANRARASQLCVSYGQSALAPILAAA